MFLEKLYCHWTLLTDQWNLKWLLYLFPKDKCFWFWVYLFIYKHVDSSYPLSFRVGRKFHEVLQLKQGRNFHLPTSKISEMMKSNSLDVSLLHLSLWSLFFRETFPSFFPLISCGDSQYSILLLQSAPIQSLLNAANGILDGSIERRSGELPQVCCWKFACSFFMHKHIWFVFYVPNSFYYVLYLVRYLVSLAILLLLSFFSSFSPACCKPIEESGAGDWATYFSPGRTSTKCKIEFCMFKMLNIFVMISLHHCSKTISLKHVKRSINWGSECLKL